jgi:cysteine synthase A
VPLRKPAGGDSADVLVKCEHLNPGGSVKDRAALAMIHAAERAGHLHPGTSTVIEATSGNTGVGLALVCAVKGYRLALVMPDNTPRERQKVLAAYGAQMHLTPAAGVMRGAVKYATALAAETEGAFLTEQFKNQENVTMHRNHTGPEILAALGGRAPDAFVAGVGTGGTITGVGRALRAVNPHVWIVAVEPTESAVLTGGRPGPHGIFGIGAGFVPALLDRGLLSEVRTVSVEDAERTCESLAQRDGLFVGISSGANVKIARDVAAELGPGKIVVTVLPDRGV